MSDDDPGMSLNCTPTRVCRKSASRPGYVVKVRTDPGYVVKQCPRIVMNKEVHTTGHKCRPRQVIGNVETGLF